MDIVEAYERLVGEHNRLVKHVDELTDHTNKLTDKIHYMEIDNKKMEDRLAQVEKVMIINGGTISDLIDASIDDKLMDIRTTMALEQELNK